MMMPEDFESSDVLTQIVRFAHRDGVDVPPAVLLALADSFEPGSVITTFYSAEIPLD